MYFKLNYVRIHKGFILSARDFDLVKKYLKKKFDQIRNCVIHFSRNNTLKYHYVFCS